LNNRVKILGILFGSLTFISLQYKKISAYFTE
jgi:hypothetical protein